jgi:hypothetical protein
LLDGILVCWPVLEQIKWATAIESLTWTELFHHRARHFKALFTPDQQESNDHHFDMFQNGPFKPISVKNYHPIFTIDIWKGDEEKPTRVKLTAKSIGAGSIKFKLPFSTLMECTALDVSVHTPTEEVSPTLLFSGASGLPHFNRFEKFYAKSFLVDLGPEIGDCAPFGVLLSAFHPSMP